MHWTILLAFDPNAVQPWIRLVTTVGGLVVTIAGLVRWLHRRRVGAQLKLEDLAAEMSSLTIDALNEVLPSQEPVDVVFRDVGSGSGAHASPTGRLETVRQYYESIDTRRMVIVGSAGAGKTVLALELQRELLTTRMPGQMVPVRVNLAAWPTQETLTDCVAAPLHEAFGAAEKHFVEAMQAQRLLLVFDDLDELDGGSEEPTRAPQVVDQLNALDFRERIPLVVTCRREFYESLPAAHRIADAVTVAVEPLTPALVSNYLRSRQLDITRWQPVIDQIRSEPTGRTGTVVDASLVALNRDSGLGGAGRPGPHRTGSADPARPFRHA